MQVDQFTVSLQLLSGVPQLRSVQIHVVSSTRIRPVREREKATGKGYSWKSLAEALYSGNNYLDTALLSLIREQGESLSQAVVFSDHCVIHYEFNACVEIPKTKSQRFVYNYKKGNFEGLRSSLSTIDLTLCIEHDNINDDWKSWRNTFLGAVSKYVPCKKLEGRKQLPWINGTIYT